MTYTATQLLNGSAGNALKAVALTSINFELARQVANHPSLKMPTTKPASPDALRDLVQMPEFENQDNGDKLDVLVNGLVASCAMIKDLAQVQDFNDSGQLVKPFAWILTNTRTPAGAVEANFAWRSNMSAKVAGEKALLLGLKNSKEIEQKASLRTDQENAERKAYALAEVNSVTNANIMNEEEHHLIEILLDLNCLDIVKLTKASAENQVKRAKERLLAGQYVTIDDEVLLYAKQ